jgi:outer membrane biosynthesis protein TonB
MDGLTRQRTVWSAALTAVGVGVLMGGGALVLAPGASATHVDPVEVPDNPSCPEGTTEVKIESPEDGDSATNDGFEVTISVNEAMQTLDFSATGGTVVATIVKGGPNANVYNYPTGETEDTGLHAPENENTPQDGDFYGLSHVSFCFGQPTPPTTPPTETPPTDTPPTETPPTDTPPTETPPTETPPTETPPTEAPPTEAPPTQAPPTDFPAGVDAAGVGGGDDNSSSMGWWTAGLIGSGALVAGGAGLALRRRGDHSA